MLIRREGSVFYSPTKLPDGESELSVGSPPSWDFASEDNEASWRDVFEDMGREVLEERAR